MIDEGYHGLAGRAGGGQWLAFAPIYEDLGFFGHEEHSFFDKILNILPKFKKFLDVLKQLF